MKASPKVQSIMSRVLSNSGTPELVRILSMVALIALCFAPDWQGLRTTTFIAGVFFAIALISHITRKYALFPYLDIKVYAVKALEEPLAAAVVFAAICGIIMVSITTAATFFAK